MTVEELEAIEHKRDIVAQHQRAYRQTFSSPAGGDVLADLAIFCRAGETCMIAPSKTAPIDVNRMLIAEGRRQVFLRIQQRMSLSTDQLFQILHGQVINNGETDG